MTVVAGLGIDPVFTAAASSFVLPLRILICQCANCFLRLLAVDEERIFLRADIDDFFGMPCLTLSPLS